MQKIKNELCIHATDDDQQIEQTSNFLETTYALPEKTKRGPPTSKYMSVRNIKAQVANMSVNENAGFKSEYQVGIFFFYICIPLKIYFIIFSTVIINKSDQV